MNRSFALFICLAFALSACASSLDAAEATTEPSASGRVAHGTFATTPSPTPVETATPAPTPDPTPRPTPEPTLEPTPSPTVAPTPTFGREPTGPTQVATVVRVTDGDTIRVAFDGGEYAVRYIGIDTPEVHGGVEWMGREASAANAELVAGREVVLESDVSETDRYGRLLRYVWVEQDGGWLLVNLELLRRGVAAISTYPPDVKYANSLYVEAQREAREAAIGLWGAAPTPAPTPVPAAPAPAAPANCEPSYPGVCIPIGIADLDCPDLDVRRFSVVWNVPNPDPHRFDGDADGIGCES